MNHSQWGVAATNRIVYEYKHERDEKRIGSCKWLPSDGDMCLCVGHSGDRFHQYLALRQREDGLWQSAGQFGAYGFWDKVAELDERNFFLAQAGEPVPMQPPST